MERTLFKPDHDAYREMVRGFVIREVVFFRENSQMLFGDAKDCAEDILRAL